MGKSLFLLVLAAILIAPESAFAGMHGMGMSGMGMHGMGMSGMGMGGIRPIPEPSALILFASSMAITAAYFRTIRKSD
jgi:hypothetical protein